MAEQQTLFVEDFHVKTCPLPAAAQDWLESDLDCGLSFYEFSKFLSRHGLLSKMSPACFPVIPDETLPSSFVGWSNAGMASAGGFLTLSISDWPNDASVCSLSEVLEVEVAPKYFLSRKACIGILRRAEKRGRELPEHLRMALEAAATDSTRTEKNS